MKKVILSVLISMSMFAFGCSSGGDGSSSNNPPTLINPVNPDSTANNSFKISSVVTAGATVYAITEDGRLYAWGYNCDGQVGNGESGGCSSYYYNPTTQRTPYEVKEVGKVKSVEVYGNGYIDGYTVYAITEDGRLYAWGYNYDGQVGNGESGIDENGIDIVQRTPYEVKEVGKVKSVEIYSGTVYAITEDNRLYAWGDNGDGEVGNGTTNDVTTPYEVKEVGKVMSVEVYGNGYIDGYTVYAITEDGRLYAWGYNRYGLVGNGESGIDENGDGIVQTTPYEVKEVGKVKSVEIYSGTVYAITEDNRLYAWGDNDDGEVGNGTTNDVTTPYEVKEVGKVMSVEIYYGTVYAITENGRLYAWGDNEYGEVGNGTTATLTTPYEVKEVGKVKSVEVNNSTVYAITEDGRLYTWGYNLYGQVGNGESGCSNSYNTSSCKKQTTPYEVTQVGKVKSVVIGYDSVVIVYNTVYAITEDGRLYSWGYNLFGQVGNGSTTGTQTTPYEVVISKY